MFNTAQDAVNSMGNSQGGILGGLMAIGMMGGFGGNMGGNIGQPLMTPNNEHPTFGSNTQGTTPKQWKRGTHTQSLSSEVNFMCSPVKKPSFEIL